MWMDVFYPFFIAFLLVFLSELGDKTQLLVLSFSTKAKSYLILLGVAIGSFLSHGIAILFGSTLGSLENPTFHIVLKLITYLSFLFLGLFGLLHKEKEPSSIRENSETSLRKVLRFSIGYVFMVAFSIAVGEIGDKTFLASLGLGIQYPSHKISLIGGAILGMVVSDSLAIVLGKLLHHKISDKTMNTLSSILFLLFGAIGLIHFFQILF